MEKQHYPATGKAAVVLWLLTIMLGIAGAVAIVAQFSKETPWWVFLGVFMGVVISSIVFAIWLDRSIDRRRWARIELALRREKLAPRMHLETSDPVPELLMVPQLEFIRSRGGWFHWVATQPLPPRHVLAFEHLVIVGSGKTAQAFTHTVIAWPLAGNLPELWLTRTNALDRWQDARRGVQDIPVGDEHFDKGWRVQCRDVEHAKTVLTAQLRALIDAGPKRERWIIGPTHACCVFSAQTNGEGVTMMLRRARDVATVIAETR
jgi:hypothetical protein